MGTERRDLWALLRRRPDMVAEEKPGKAVTLLPLRRLPTWDNKEKSAVTLRRPLRLITCSNKQETSA